MAKNPLPSAIDAPDPAVKQMHDELRALLDGVPGSRKVLRMLTTIEYNLKQRGSASFIDDLPVPALQQALRQLDGLSTPRSAGLAALRAQLLDAIALHQRLAREAAAQSVRRLSPTSSFLTDDKLLVQEASMSDFDRAAGGFAPTAAPDTIPGVA
jgi:hypothetical protein